MGIEDFSRRDQNHLVIDIFRKQAKFKVPPRDLGKPKAGRDDYKAHAASLINQVTTALDTVPVDDRTSRLSISGMFPGTVVKVTTQVPDTVRKKSKMPQGLDFPLQDIVVLRTERQPDNSETGLLFIPDGQRDFLVNRIRQYGRDPGNQRRPDVAAFEPLETLVRIDPSALFSSKVDFNDTAPRWWEFWIRGDVQRARDVAQLAKNAGFDVSAEQLVFPDTVVSFVHGHVGAISTFVGRIWGAITEVRPVTDTIESILVVAKDGVESQAFVDDLLNRVVSAPADAATVCVMDTGVAAGHPLLAVGLVGVWALDDAWGSDDDYRNDGHGTPMVGLALYGDLLSPIQSQGPFHLTHHAESMKLLAPVGFLRTEAAKYGVVTQSAVARVESERNVDLRSYVLALTARVPSAERPSSWSGAVDQICAGSMLGDQLDKNQTAAQRPKRLVLIAGGNVEHGSLAEVSDYYSIQDPAQSWNALTIGGFTEKYASPLAQPHLLPVAAPNDRSPFSPVSSMLPTDLTPIKPEVLFEAGNMIIGDDGHCTWHECVSLLSAGKQIQQAPLVPMWATSAASALAGRFMGELQSTLPNLWPETHRALTVQSAEWPTPISKLFYKKGAHWTTGTKGKKQEAIRQMGFGVPNIEAARKSSLNAVTLITQQEIQPFAYGADGKNAVYNDFHFFDLPWPVAALEELENAVVMLKVALSYFIEPNLNGKAATRPDTYRSFGLRFRLKRRLESFDDFRDRVSADQRDEKPKEKTSANGGPKVKTKGESDYWLLGSNSMNAGSLHCDIWRGHAIDLAGHDGIAIYPVGGWWKSHPSKDRVEDTGRYSLVMTLSAPGYEIDLHSEIAQQISTETRNALLRAGVLV